MNREQQRIKYQGRKKREKKVVEYRRIVDGKKKKVRSKEGKEIRKQKEEIEKEKTKNRYEKACKKEKK